MCRHCGLMWIIAVLVVTFVSISVALHDSSQAPSILAAGQQQDAAQQQRQRQAGDAAPGDLVTVNDVVYATITNDDGSTIEMTMDTAFAKQSDGKPMPVVVYIHGGGFRSGNKSDGRAFSTVLASGGYFAATISYRLSDVAQFPAAVHDCKAAIRFLRANAKRLAIDPDRIGVWGHSAGGHLAAYLALTGNAPQTEGTVGTTGVSSAVHCAVPISGVFNFANSGSGGERLRYWLGDATGDAWTARLRDASPISWVDAEDPPMLLIHGTADRTVPSAQSIDLHTKLGEAGVDALLQLVEGAGHTIRDRSVYNDAIEFMNKHLGGNAGRQSPPKGTTASPAPGPLRPAPVSSAQGQVADTPS